MNGTTDTHTNSHTITPSQRSKLLDNSDRLQRTSNRLEEGYRIAQETEEIGLDIMDNLQRDRETISRTRGRVSVCMYTFQAGDILY